MANEEQLAILRRGVAAWNAWRREHEGLTPDLSKADLSEANLSRAYLYGATLYGATLNDANLGRATLNDATLSRADLSGATLSEADLSKANLSEADLQFATLVGTNFSGATLSGCKVYGVAAWSLRLKGAVQTNLAINAHNEPTITVDNLEVAQFLYLMLHNEKIRDVIHTLTSKVVLILGRFTPERKAVLDGIREALRQRNYVPVFFDFDEPSYRNIRETVTLLARMARFIIADLTEPSSLPLELEAIVPVVAVPVQPIIMQDNQPFSMFASLRMFPRMLPVYRYADQDALLATLHERVIAPAEAKVKEVRTLKLQQADTE